jgi:hypothetical protein
VPSPTAPKRTPRSKSANMIERCHGMEVLCQL